MGGCGSKSSASTTQVKVKEPETLLNKYAAQAEILKAQIPDPKPLTDLLSDIIFVKDFRKTNKDILRLIRRVSIYNRETDQTIKLDKQKLPDILDGKPEKQGVYLVLILMKELISFFEGDAAEDLIAKLDDCFQQWKLDTVLNEEEKQEEDEFTVLKLVELVGGDKTKTVLGLRCIDQSIAISGHMHIKSKVAPDFTKDMPGTEGWQVLFTLADYVQVKHTRREKNAMPPKSNDWSVEYSVHMTFDLNMSEITRSSLRITDLYLAEQMDPEYKVYLEERFNKGDLVVT
eukprot:augustus_masked-scaffold_30-processed-gene-3.16-mRNA-1 protein AED:1.00 eAED:1.00 QI:0/-1/0/0/-1/1/1/0/287